MNVDDDPAVSRAVARDLRRQYGESHRVMRASSGRYGGDLTVESVPGDTRYVVRLPLTERPRPDA